MNHTQEKIIVLIDEEGSSEVTVKGHRGPGCQKLTEALERDLGAATSDRRTAEYEQQSLNRHESLASLKAGK
jgi:hypothetical protein